MSVHPSTPTSVAGDRVAATRAAPGTAADVGPPRAPAARLRLDDQLCFALYTAASAIVRNYRPLLRELDLTYPQYVLLMTLWECDGSNVGDIAARLRVPVNNIAPMLDRLEHAGLLERRRSSEDRRHIQVVLTDEGRAMERRAAEAQFQVHCQTRLGPEAHRQLREELNALTHTLDDRL